MKKFIKLGVCATCMALMLSACGTGKEADESAKNMEENVSTENSGNGNGETTPQANSEQGNYFGELELEVLGVKIVPGVTTYGEVCHLLNDTDSNDDVYDFPYSVGDAAYCGSRLEVDDALDDLYDEDQEAWKRSISGLYFYLRSSEQGTYSSRNDCIISGVKITFGKNMSVKVNGKEITPEDIADGSSDVIEFTGRASVNGTEMYLETRSDYNGNGVLEYGICETRDFYDVMFNNAKYEGDIIASGNANLVDDRIQGIVVDGNLLQMPCKLKDIIDTYTVIMGADHFPLVLENHEKMRGGVTAPFYVVLGNGSVLYMEASCANYNPEPVNILEATVIELRLSKPYDSEIFDGTRVKFFGEANMAMPFSEVKEMAETTWKNKLEVSVEDIVGEFLYVRDDYDEVMIEENMFGGEINRVTILVLPE